MRCSGALNSATTSTPNKHAVFPSLPPRSCAAARGKAAKPPAAAAGRQRARGPLRVQAMRCVIQRVTSASVEVEGKLVSSIGPGLLCLVGITSTDTAKEAELLVRKILRCKAFGDKQDGKPWTDDVTTMKGEVLLVSQFTLYGRLKKPKPDFSRAMAPDQARDAYSALVEAVKAAYVSERVKDGVFGAMMKVKLENDGPVTFILDTADFLAGSAADSSTSLDEAA